MTLIQPNGKNQACLGVNKESPMTNEKLFSQLTPDEQTELLSQVSAKKRFIIEIKDEASQKTIEIFDDSLHTKAMYKATKDMLYHNKMGWAICFVTTLLTFPITQPSCSLTLLLAVISLYTTLYFVNHHMLSKYKQEYTKANTEYKAYKQTIMERIHQYNQNHPE